MNTLKYEALMRGLIETITEMNCVLGDIATDDINYLIDMIQDLENFWNSDGSLSKIDWMKTTAKALAAVNKNEK